MFGCAINKTQLIIQGDNQSFYRIDTVMMAGLGNSESYNNTPPFSSSLRKPDPVSMSSSRVSNFGIIASSNKPVSVFGIKSDKGTTDGYYMFPQTNNSVEFIIAGWPRIEGQPFLAMIMAVPVLDGTCIELFKIYNGNQYERIAFENVGRFQVFRYFASYATYLENGAIVQNNTVGEDVTGMYLNCSKPCQVIFGGECSWVSTPDDLFCDYIAETIPPINQVGSTYIVPPILGRSVAAGYIVRVIPVKDNCAVTYEGGTATVRLGDFLQFDHPGTNTVAVVTCDKPCMVYQYNKGYLKYNDVPTDPFMQMIVPVDRFTAGAPFGTASFCKDRNVLINFNNYISVVTFDAYKDNILFDGSPISEQQTDVQYNWIPVTVNGIDYVACGFPVDHGFHYVSMSAGTEGSFAVYAYGHSADPSSSSGYGFFCNYNSTGQGISDAFEEAKEEGANAGGNPDMNSTCTSEEYLVGSIISSNVGEYAPFPFRLRAGIDPGVPLTPACLAQYHDQLLQLLRDFSKKINYWICVSQNCSYLGGEGVAINYNTLDVQYFGNGGVYYAVEIYVEMIARMDVTADNFATCRAEIQNYMYYFINWPPAYTQDLLHQIVGSGCPWPIPFQKPQFVAMPLDCPTVFD